MKKSIKVLLTTFLVGVLFCACFSASVSAQVHQGTLDKTLNWTLDDESGLLTVSGKGEIWGRNNAFEDFQRQVVTPYKYLIKNAVFEEKANFLSPFIGDLKETLWIFMEVGYPYLYFNT